ncbi:winged helix-turn-helix domain-containing protein [Prosthecomicrobium pneumaticum]|uniref:Cytoplasmic protein n=1 Tax=Prosthecomicrobium pneumaticum TaxID=81895 RepID=A0A7W9L385_9HYPH|nr:crosslink repair DNA glycosylase YcaQ family protein [Prosthecomicrobium pneumaticum]MBB5754297.1 hypothetical protein [Prosthecomicrobium pneumaticum]
MDAPSELPAPRTVLSAEEARRLALASQGFSTRRAGAARWSALAAGIERMGLLQLDSVNVLVRSHYLPLYSRLGGYDRAVLDHRVFDAGRQRAAFEYWAHEASVLPLDLQPMMRWRMRRAADGEGIYGGLVRFAREQPAYVAAVLDEIGRRGPTAASALDDPGERSGPWWGWHKGKIALEYLFWTGAVTTAHRRNFERIYDLTERALPAEVTARPTPEEPDAIRALVARSATALGIGTEADLRDYFRLPVEPARRAIGELVEAGALLPATVEGWRHPAFLDAAAAPPARATPSALLSPFDPLVWFRPRTERIFGFHYRLEFYTPEPKRTFGYFVMPFLHRGRLEARVDLKADRAGKRLLALGAFAEPGVRHGPLAAALADELIRLADWLGLETVALGSRGDLAAALIAAATDPRFVRL